MSVAALSLLAACATDPYTGESRVSKTAWGTGIGAVSCKTLGGRKMLFLPDWNG